MQKLGKWKKLISWLMIFTMLITMLPSSSVANAADTDGAVSRAVTDVVNASSEGNTIKLDLYSNGIYETKVSAVSGSAISLSVNEAVKGTTTFTVPEGQSAYLRYNSVTGEITNSFDSSNQYKQSATWTGDLDGLGNGIGEWEPADLDGDLDYLGGGIFSKTFMFPKTEASVTLEYKIAYNHAWGNGEVSDNVTLTIPEDTSEITVFADTNTGYITDSINTPNIGDTVSIIGTVRESGEPNWDPSQSGWEMRRISKDYYTTSKVFENPGTYEYKCVLNHETWPSWDNRSFTTIEPNTNVVFLYNAAADEMYDSCNQYNTVAEVFGFPKSGEAELLADTFTNQPGGSSTWRVTGGLGNYDSWKIDNPNTVMSHLVGEFYAKSMVLDKGTYEFKFTKNGSWDNAIGSDGINNNAANFKFTLEEKSKVNFYLNDELEGLDKVRINIADVAGIKQYSPVLEDAKWPRLVGSLQTELGEEKDWEPSIAKNKFVDYFFNNTVYKVERTLPTGSYECKVVFGSGWSDGNNFGDANGNNLALKIMEASGDVTFSIDYSADKKALSYQYKPKESDYDGMIDTPSLYFNSQVTTYKNPFGAIKQESEDVTFRFATKTQDAQLVKLELINQNGISSTYDMSVATMLDGKDYWEVTIPKDEFKEIGIWGYKFIILDGTTKYEYGDDGVSGGTGACSEDGQTPYNLTVFAKDYATPDWMKNAVVYQIFADRFYDGDSSNNHAKDVDGYRGDEVQLFDGNSWSTIPENPRQSEEANKPYYPDAKTDGVWSNEFYGGDIEGIGEKLSYLKTLGVTAIYLNPVSWAASNHKYDATDYKHLDPMFGEPVYNKSDDPTSGLNYEATKEASDQVYHKFAKACDKVGINLITDGVFNHVGDDSIYFDRYEKYPEIGAYEYWSRVWNLVEQDDLTQAAAEAKVKAYYKSEVNPATNKHYTDADFCYINWFKVGADKVYDEITGQFERYNYEGWWGYDSLPVISTVEESETNLSNDAKATISGEHEYNNVTYRENVIGYDLEKANVTDDSQAMQQANSQRWLWMGSSGWRLDVAPDVSNETWKQFRTAVKSAGGKTDVNGSAIDEPVILGEEWGVATEYLLGDMFDSVMNYQFRAALQNFIVNDGDASELNNALEVIRENYPKEAWLAMLNLVDSHDTVRNITKIDNPTWEEENIKIAPDASEKAIKLQALTAIFQMSYPGAPTIYYGDEVGVTGTKDPDSRRTFPWERVTQNGDGTYGISSSYSDYYGDLYNAYVKASKVRNDHMDLFATGDIKMAYAQGDVITYARKSQKEGGLSIINKSEQAVDIVADVTDFLPDGLELVDQLGTNQSAKVVNGTVTIHVPAYTGMMMVSSTKLNALPAAPTNLIATATDGETGKVTLTWDPVEGASGYQVYRALLDGMEIKKISDQPVTDPTYTDTDVVNGTRYYYYVKSNRDDAVSVYSKVATALPSFKITHITTPTAVENLVIGVGKKTENTEVTIAIPGLTDNPSYKGKEVPGLQFHLAYYKEGDAVTQALETKLHYKEDGSQGKVYTAAFEPTEEGIYRYFGKATVNNGFTFTKSSEATMSATTSFEAAEPATPDLMEPLQESSRVTLNWNVASKDNISGFEIYRTYINSDGKTVRNKIVTLDNAAITYTDFMVSNDIAYTYQVVAYNQEYNRAMSKTVTVTPKLTMVDVTLRLNIPDKVFTSATDNIYIAGDVNGWNASGWLLKKPSGATDNNIVEYSFKMMAGKKIQYKYTRGSWATEALTSSIANDTTSPGNYGYSSTDTNINLTITNQGNNKMLVNDYVLRWVDMPIMVTVPRISYHGETIEYTTAENSFNLQASVPFGGIFTINGTDINSIAKGALDEFGNVRLDNIPLKTGVNEYELHIEPSAATKAQPWLTDMGRIISQMTATTKIKITKTGDTPTNPTTPPTPSNPSSPSNDDTTSNPSKGKEPQIQGMDGTTGWKSIQTELVKLVANLVDKKETTVVRINMNGTTILPKEILEVIKGKNVDLVLDFGNYTWTIHGSSMTQDAVIAKDYDLNISEIKDTSKLSAIHEAINSALRKSKAVYKDIEIQQFEIAHSGVLLFAADLTIKVDKKYSNRMVYLNYYNEGTKRITLYDYAKVDKDGFVTLTFDHTSAYVLTSENPILPTVIRSKTMYMGSEYKLRISNLLKDAKVTYRSSNKSILVISKTGQMKAKKVGSTTVIVKVVQAGKTYQFRTKVTIKKK